MQLHNDIVIDVDSFRFINIIIDIVTCSKVSNDKDFKIKYLQRR